MASAAGPEPIDFEVKERYYIDIKNDHDACELRTVVVFCNDYDGCVYYDEMFAKIVSRDELKDLFFKNLLMVKDNDLMKVAKPDTYMEFEDYSYVQCDGKAYYSEGHTF